MFAQLQGFVRGLARGGNLPDGIMANLYMNPQGFLLNANGLPERTEIARLSSEDEPLDGVVLGLPRRLDGTATAMTAPIEAGEVKIREHVLDGLEAAPAGLAELLGGGNFGKVVVRIG